MNCVGAVKLARILGPGKVIVTILCDGGQRCVSLSCYKVAAVPPHNGNCLVLVFLVTGPFQYVIKLHLIASSSS